MIAGGSGFLGSHLCEDLIAKGHSVVCADNLLTGLAKNVQHLSGLNEFEFVKRDITQNFEIAGPLDGVLHLATPTSPPAYQRHPIETLKAGALATFNLLEVAKTNNARFLLTSTSEVYGDPEEHPQTEEYWGHVNPIGPRSMYDEAKRFAEATTVAYHRAHNVDVKIVRIFNTYGPRMRADDGRVIPAIVSRALKNEPVVLYGDGSQTRSFCYVRDLVRGMAAMLLSEEHGPVNLGNTEEITMLELANRLIELCNSNSQVVFEPAREEDPVRRKPNIDKAKRTLGWEPNVSLTDGLNRTIEWLKENLESTDGIPEPVPVGVNGYRP